jgi:hypothetical protein
VFTDDTLLEGLATMLEPTELLPSEPSAAELDALRMAVAEQFGMASLADGTSGHELALLEAALSADGALPAGPSDDELSRLGSTVSEVFGTERAERSAEGGIVIALGDAQSRLGARLRRRLIGGTGIFVTAGVLATGAAAAAATAAHVPFTRPIAQIAHDLGLPVHSPAYDDAQAKADQLTEDVKEHDVAAIAGDLASLRHEEGMLDPGERSQVVADSSPAVAQAETVIDSNPSPGPPVDVTPPPDETTVPSDTTTTSPDESTTTTTDATTSTTDTSNSSTTTSGNPTP